MKLLNKNKYNLLSIVFIFIIVFILLYLYFLYNKSLLKVYWGVELSNDLFEIPEIKHFLKNHKNLISLPKIHSTLIYNNTSYDEYYSLYENKECTLIVPSYAYSYDALVLNVESVKYNNKNINTHNIKQHITLALKKNISPVESIKTLLGQGTIVNFKFPLIIYGKIKKFNFN